MRCKSSNIGLNPVVWQNRTALTPSSAVSFLLFFTFSGSSLLTRSIVASSPNSLSKSRQDSSSSSRSSFCSQFLRLLLASSKTCRHFCSRSGSSTDSSNLAELIQTCGTGSSQQRTRRCLSELSEFCVKFHLDVLGALQQPFVEVPGVFILFLLDLKVDVGLPQYLKNPEQRAPWF